MIKEPDYEITFETLLKHFHEERLESQKKHHHLAPHIDTNIVKVASDVQTLASAGPEALVWPGLQNITYWACMHMTEEQFKLAIASLSLSNPSDILSAWSLSKAEFVRETEKDLTHAFEYYVSIGLFQQGVEYKCGECGTTFWHDLSTMDAKVRCPGCFVDVGISIEATWKYHLNGLIANSVRHYGGTAMLYTLYRLLDDSRNSFVYVPCCKLMRREGGKYVDKCELDIACISDGKLLIGEVKTSTNDFSQAELDKLFNIAVELMPDGVVIAAFKGNLHNLPKVASDLERRLKPYDIGVHVIAPDQAASMAAHHP